MTKKPKAPLTVHQQRKNTLLPQITELAMQGKNCREIGKILDLGKSTVNNWFREVRQECDARQALTPAEIIAMHITRYELIYRKAIEAWDRSQADKRVRLVEDTDTGNEEGCKKKKSIRFESRAGEVVYLNKAMDALKAIERLRGIAPPRPSGAAALDNPADLAALTPDDLKNLSDEQLAALDARFVAGDSGLCPSLSAADLQNMSLEQLAALEGQLKAQIDASQDQRGKGTAVEQGAAR